MNILQMATVALSLGLIFFILKTLIDKIEKRSNDNIVALQGEINDLKNALIGMSVIVDNIIPKNKRNKINNLFKDEKILKSTKD